MANPERLSKVIKPAIGLMLATAALSGCSSDKKTSTIDRSLPTAAEENRAQLSPSQVSQANDAAKTSASTIAASIAKAETYQLGVNKRVTRRTFSNDAGYSVELDSRVEGEDRLKNYVVTKDRTFTVSTSISIDGMKVAISDRSDNGCFNKFTDKQVTNDDESLNCNTADNSRMLTFLNKARTGANTVGGRIELDTFLDDKDTQLVAATTSDSGNSQYTLSTSGLVKLSGAYYVAYDQASFEEALNWRQDLDQSAN